MTDRPSKLQKYFQNAVKAMGDQDYDGAVAWFSALLEISPLDEEALQLCEKSQILLAQQKLNAVKKIGYQIWGNLGYSLGMHKSVVNILGVLSLDKPQDPGLAAKYAKSLMAAGQPALAAMAYRRALRFTTSNKAMLKGAGEAFEKIDDKPAAIDVYSTLMKLEPHNGVWPIKVKDLSAEHYGKTGGITDLKKSRSEEEKKAATQQTSEGKAERIKELLDQYKQDPEEKVHLLPEIGRLLIQMERFDHALSIWTRILESIEKKRREAEEAAAAAETQEEAESGRKAAEALAHNWEEAKFNQALSYEKRGDLDKAEPAYAELMEKFPSDPRYCDSLYNLRAQRIQTRLDADPDDAMLVQEKEKVARERLVRMVEIYRQLSEKRAGDPDTLLAYGDLLRKKGDLETAIPVLQKVAQNPARAYPALRKLGHLFLERGQVPLAIDSYQRALEKAPHSRSITNEIKEIWYGLGEAHLKQGDENGARDWFKKIYETDIEFRDIRERYEALL